MYPSYGSAYGAAYGNHGSAYGAAYGNHGSVQPSSQGYDAHSPGPYARPEVARHPAPSAPPHGYYAQQVTGHAPQWDPVTPPPPRPVYDQAAYEGHYRYSAAASSTDAHGYSSAPSAYDSSSHYHYSAPPLGYSAPSHDHYSAPPHSRYDSSSSAPPPPHAYTETPTTSSYVPASHAHNYASHNAYGWPDERYQYQAPAPPPPGYGSHASYNAAPPTHHSPQPHDHYPGGPTGYHYQRPPTPPKPFGKGDRSRGKGSGKGDRREGNSNLVNHHSSKTSKGGSRPNAKGPTFTHPAPRVEKEAIPVEVAPPIPAPPLSAVRPAKPSSAIDANARLAQWVESHPEWLIAWIEGIDPPQRPARSPNSTLCVVGNRGIPSESMEAEANNWFGFLCARSCGRERSDREKDCATDIIKVLEALKIEEALAWCIVDPVGKETTAKDIEDLTHHVQQRFPGFTCHLPEPSSMVITSCEARSPHTPANGAHPELALLDEFEPGFGELLTEARRVEGLVRKQWYVALLRVTPRPSPTMHSITLGMGIATEKPLAKARALRSAWRRLEVLEAGWFERPSEND